MEEIYKSLLSDPRPAILKSDLPDGKIAITLLVSDPELANDIVVTAKKMNVAVLEDSDVTKNKNSSLQSMLLEKAKKQQGKI